MKRIGLCISCAVFAFIPLFVYTVKQSAQSGTFTTASVPTGTGPRAVAVNSVTNKIYVANCNICGVGSGSMSNVTVIDGTNNATTTVATGADSRSVAVNPVTNKIYVANFISNDVTVIDGTNDSVAATVAAGSSPVAIAVNSVTNKIYVANHNSNDVTVIDGANNSAVTVAAGTNPRAVAINQVTNKIYVTNQSLGGTVPDGTVTVIDGSNNSTATISTGFEPFGLAVNSVTNKIYVACNASGNITAIDGTDNSTTTIADPDHASAVQVAVNPVTNKVYVIHSNSPDVTVIDGTNNSTTVVPGQNSSDPQALAIDTETNKIYVADCGTGCEGGDNVIVIDGTDNSISGIPTPGANTVDIAVNPGTHKVYVANQDSNDVTVITPPAMGNTGTGTNVSVSPAPGVTVTFSQVTAPGNTTATALVPGNNAPPPPTGFTVDGIMYDISTTASFVPPVTICFPYDPSDPNPQLYHFENGQWVDVTTSVDTVNHIVCGSVSSLSPFAVLTPTAPASVQTTFVIGDLSAVAGNKVTFWSSQWTKENSLSGGPAPASFKGFADATSPKVPACGGEWTSHPGNSSQPPASVPKFITVLVADSVSKSGPVISGNITKMVVVRTDPGYSPDPGHTGTGTVVAVLCSETR